MEKEMGIEKSKGGKTEVKLDPIGFAISSLCAIHCALMPFVITFLPLIGLEFLAEPWMEISIILLSILVGIGSLIPSYRKYHHNAKPICFLITGFAFIFSSHFLDLHEFEPILMPIGGVSIAVAHYFNWKLLKQYRGHSCMKQEV